MDSEKFRRKFQNECNTLHFRDRVRSVIREENFLKDLFSVLNFSSEVNRVATPIVEAKVNAFALYQLPRLVNIQITSYLDNNRQMSDILTKHSTNLEKKLEVKANEVLTKVVNEPKFHTLSNLHFQEIDRKNEAKSEELTLSLNKRFDDEVQTMQIRIDNLEHNQNILLLIGVSTLIGLGGLCYHLNDNNRRKY